MRPPARWCHRATKKSRWTKLTSLWKISTNRNIKSFDALFIEERIVSSSLRDTLLEDKIDDRPNRVIEDYRKQHPDEATSNETLNAQIEIYRRLRPSNPATVEISNTFFNNLFFKTEYYDLSRVGRLKLNRKLSISMEEAASIV